MSEANRERNVARDRSRQYDPVLRQAVRGIGYVTMVALGAAGVGLLLAVVVAWAY